MARQWYGALVMDSDTEREINHIWDRLREHGGTISGVAVLQVQMQNLIREVQEMKANRKWVVAQFIATVGVLATVIALVMKR